jgi:hypothetical protein
MDSEQNIISHHIFLFPFTIEHRNQGNFMEKAADALPKGIWTETSFFPEGYRPESTTREKAKYYARYSEYHYYHPFIRERFFPQIPGKKAADGTPPLMRFFSAQPQPGDTFSFTFNCKKYALELKNVHLRLFETEIGILSFEVVNCVHSELADILIINDVGRRIYPQYLGDNGVEAVQGSFLAQKIDFTLAGRTYTEDFKAANNEPGPVVAKYIRELLGSRFTLDKACFSASGGSDFLYKPTIDDRMYVVCWYGSDEWAEALQCKKADGSYEYEGSEMWARFIFHDGSFNCCQHPVMMRRLIKETTYERWVDTGLFFGLSRYGLVCLTKRTDWFPFNIIRQHVRRHYTQMAVILLTQRASVIRFSERVADTSGRFVSNSATGSALKKQVRDFEDRVEKLHHHYIRFVNRIWFTEVTPQEQGIEMYSQAAKVMRLKEDVTDLNQEIRELHDFTTGLTAREENRQIRSLTIMGALFLPITVITGFFGMNLKFIEDGFAGLPFFADAMEKTTLLPSLKMILLFLPGFLFLAAILWFAYHRVMRGYFRELRDDSADVSDYLTWAKFKQAIQCKKP